MPTCDQCGQRYTSMLAAAECADFDREDERRTRAALSHVAPGPRHGHWAIDRDYDGRDDW